MKVACGNLRGRQRWVAGALAALAAWPLSAAVLDPPREYRVRGTLVATILGPRCCGEAQFTGRFRAAYQVETSGAVRLGGFSFELDDRDVNVSTGFLDFTEAMTVRCAGGTTRLPAFGSTDGPDWLKLPPGAVEVYGAFAPSGESESGCPGEVIRFQGANAAEVRLLHQPSSDHVQLDAVFSAAVGGEPGSDIYELRIAGVGRFENRPPVADLAFRYPDGVYPQGGCPAYLFWNGQAWERRAEANTPEGLLAYLVSYSSDPDGPWGRADIFAERWFDRRDGGLPQRLADGRDVGPFTFEWGPEHSVELLAFDLSGARAAETCVFRVVDTTAPAVTPAPDLVTGCTTSGGATPATSPPLFAFLAGATAQDAADPAPTRLPAQRGGVDVTPSTLFPADGLARSVSLRFRDFAGNVGSADGLVTVVDGVAPGATLGVNRPELAPDFKFWAIDVTASLSDDCGGPVSLRLISIQSNAPAFDGSDVIGAAYGTDDRGFFLFSRPAGAGVARLYTIVYEAQDGAGNSRLVETTVKVTAEAAAQVAVFDATLGAPRCPDVGRSCDSGTSLLRGRATLGPEPNRPNTIAGSCADGPTGVFHSDESNDRLVVETLDGSELAAGRTVRVKATVWAYATFAADHLDLYYAANAASPSWIRFATLTPSGAGAQTLSATYTLPSGAHQAVRARFRYNGAAAPCGAGPYDDHDDLAFTVR